MDERGHLTEVTNQSHLKHHYAELYTVRAAGINPTQTHTCTLTLTDRPRV